MTLAPLNLASEASTLGPPGAAGRFIQAVNRSDLEALCGCFSADALVNDQLRDFWGRRAIDAWAQEEVIDERLALRVTEIREHHGEVIVTAAADGDFDRDGLPDPLMLTLHFTLRQAWIVRLIILVNLASGAEPQIRRQAAPLATWAVDGRVSRSGPEGCGPCGGPED